MSKFRFNLLALCFLLFCWSDADAQSMTSQVSNKKTLVAYYSFTGNVETIVNELKTQLSADVIEIEPAEEGIDYAANGYEKGSALIAAIKADPTDASSYPAIKPLNVNLAQYDNIIIATPLWWSQMAAPMQTFLFLRGTEMAGKNIGLIVSSASSGINGVEADAQRLIPDGNFMEPSLLIKASEVSSAATKVSTWLGQTFLPQIKVVVLSDTHVMASELLINDGDAWQSYLAADRKMVDNSKALFDEMVSKIKTNIKPDFVFITGDLTKDGEKLSHQYVKGKLDELKIAGIQTLVIPGNHDRGANANAVYYDGATTTPAEVADDDYFATTYADYGYGALSEREATSLTYACEPINGLVVIGMDSGTDGQLSSTTLEWVRNKAQAATAAGKQVVAMMHHPLVPHFYGCDKFVETSVVANYETVRNNLADAGIKVVFTGHFHTSDVAKDWNAGLTQEIYDVNTGSLISYPCDYREVTLSNNLSELSIITGHMADVLPKQIKVTDGTHSVTFELNETSAAQSLYGMLPITREVQNYSTNEKIFYPETAISYGSDCIEDDCPAGTLALFSPWGNVVMYYGAASKYTGLYVLGHAVEGEDQICELTGNITVTQVGLAKERLRTAVKNTISAKGSVYSSMAPTAAEAFIIHAEGDEAGNANSPTVLTQLVSAANMGAMIIGADKAQALKDMAYSMLQDKSQYGVSGRENQTDDLSLTIDMPTFSTVSLTMNAVGVMTYASSRPLDFSSVEGLTAYYASDFTDETSTLVMTPVNKASVGSGMLLVGTANATYSIPVTSSATDNLNSNCLKGLVSPTNVSTTDGLYTNHILANGGEGIGWYKLSEAGKLKANSAYLQLPTSSLSAPVRVVYDEVVTAIPALATDSNQQETANSWYTLTGVKLKGKPTKSGLYIIGRKKVYLNIK